ncbi:hypothetical protein [Undibacterium sp. TJN19]|uniref:hypothetical protein n=1 Tax=Undibacterium sp. TJN19 TaxID=3413055 RepID=UPI003BF08517
METDIKQKVLQDICEDLWSAAANLPANHTNGQLIPGNYSRQELRKKILLLQEQMCEAQASGDIEKCDMDEVFPLRHLFAPGAYAREMSLPKGHWIIGKIHKHAHLNFISKGRVAVLTEEGPMIIEAPYTFISSVGTKRVVLVLEDTLWTTVHITNETDLEKIEEEVIAKTYDDIPQIENTVKEIT